MSRHIFTFAAVIIALLSITKSAQTAVVYYFFPNDATIDYTIDANGFAVVGYAGFDNNGKFTGASNPTINIVNGAYIKLLAFSAYNSSIVNMNGGRIVNAINANNNSTINLHGGSAGSVYAGNSTLVNIYGSQLQLHKMEPYSTGFHYTVSGHLSDGTDLAGVNFYIYDDAKINLSSTLSVEITANAPPDGIYRITADPSMPQISATANVIGANPDPTPSTTFTWTLQIKYIGVGYNGSDRPINISLPPQTTVGTAPYIPNFGQSFRGGDLTITVQATVNGQTLTKQTIGLAIVSANVPRSEIQKVLPHDTLRRIATLESGQKQFDSDGYPFWNEKDGGVGVLQVTPTSLTDPHPTDDEVWNWRLNVQQGIAIFNDKISEGLNYPRLVRNSPTFSLMVKEYNFRRARMGLQPITITLPPFSTNGGNYSNVLNDDTSNQLELNTIRAFNGMAGKDIFGPYKRSDGSLYNILPEFKVGVTFDFATGKNVLKVIFNEQTRTGQCVWERVTVGERSAQFPNGYPGDANYVTHVLNSNPRP